MSKKTVTIVTHDKLVEFVKSLDKRSSDIKSKLAPVLKGLWKSKRPNKVIRNNIDFEALRISFPQFKQVIDYIQLQVNVSRKFNRPFKLSPILLLGDAGLGKTMFVSEVAKLLKLPYFEMSLATVTANFALSGGSLQWGEGSPGFIIKSLSESKTANPIILIDEIDKAGGDPRYSVISSFYSLLEPHTANRFKDEAIPLELDASNVSWIATANESTNINGPILSRMKYFQIKQPLPSEMLGVIDSIYSMLLKHNSLESFLSASLDDEVKQQLVYLSPREVRLSLDEAMMKALIDQRNCVCIDDLSGIKEEVRRVGFL